MLSERHVEAHRLAVPRDEVSVLLHFGAVAKAPLYERLAGRVLAVPLELRVGHFRLLHFIFRGGCGGQLSSTVHLRNIVSRLSCPLNVSLSVCFCCRFIESLAYTIGSAYFVMGSYPEDYVAQYVLNGNKVPPLDSHGVDRPTFNGNEDPEADTNSISGKSDSSDGAANEGSRSWFGWLSGSQSATDQRTLLTSADPQ